MKLLLDTHAFLWFVLADPKLKATALDLISDRDNDILVSPASYWEIAIKVSLKRLELRASFDDFMQRGIEGNDFEILPIETRHASKLSTLPYHHGDPFDRMLIAQALVEAIPIVSVDGQFDHYGVQRLW